MSFVLPHLPVGRRGVHHPVRNPHLLRLPRLDDAAGEDEVEGAGEADQLREADLEKEAKNVPISATIPQFTRICNSNKKNARRKSWSGKIGFC